MTRTRNRVALIATVTTALAAGGLAAASKRAVTTQRGRPDPEAPTLAGQPRCDRVTPVRAADGVRLHVEEVGRTDASLTVVFVHGWTCTMETWIYQRRDLAADEVRLVLYDQRGHGRSDRPDGEPEHSSIDILGDDLRRVLEATVPTGPVVLVGHSMGGMTIMSLADRSPELFAPGGRVTGVALLSTSAGSLASVSLGLPAAVIAVVSRLLPGGFRAVASFGDRLESRRRPSDLTWALARHLAYGSEVPPSLVDLMERMMAQSPLATTASFGGALLSHDKLAALGALRSLPTLILVGERDVLTPVDHSRAIAKALPCADVVVLSGAGHMIMLERPALTSLHLRTLLGRAADGQVAPGRQPAASR